MSRFRAGWGFGALGAIVLSLLSGAAGASAGIPKKDVWYTQHYMILQDFERKLYRDLSEEGRKGFQDLFLGGPDRPGPGQVQGPHGVRIRKLQDREQESALEHRPGPDLSAQRPAGFDRL